MFFILSFSSFFSYISFFSLGPRPSRVPFLRPQRPDTPNQIGLSYPKCGPEITDQQTDRQTSPLPLRGCKRQWTNQQQWNNKLGKCEKKSNKDYPKICFRFSVFSPEARHRRRRRRPHHRRRRSWPQRRRRSAPAPCCAVSCVWRRLDCASFRKFRLSRLP